MFFNTLILKQTCVYFWPQGASKTRVNLTFAVDGRTHSSEDNSTNDDIQYNLKTGNKAPLYIIVQ